MRRSISIAGHIVLSINAIDGARKVFGRFAIKEVETTYTISTATSSGGKRVKKLIVRGPC